MPLLMCKYLNRRNVGLSHNIISITDAGDGKALMLTEGDAFATIDNQWITIAGTGYTQYNRLVKAGGTGDNYFRLYTDQDGVGQVEYIGDVFGGTWELFTDLAHLIVSMVYDDPIVTVTCGADISGLVLGGDHIVMPGGIGVVEVTDISTVNAFTFGASSFTDVSGQLWAGPLVPHSQKYTANTVIPQATIQEWVGTVRIGATGTAANGEDTNGGGGAGFVGADLQASVVTGDIGIDIGNFDYTQVSLYANSSSAVLKARNASSSSGGTGGIYDPDNVLTDTIINFGGDGGIDIGGGGGNATRIGNGQSGGDGDGVGTGGLGGTDGDGNDGGGGGDEINGQNGINGGGGGIIVSNGGSPGTGTPGFVDVGWYTLP